MLVLAEENNTIKTYKEMAHYETEEAEMTEKSYTTFKTTCEIKTFTNTESLNTHLTIHSVEKTYNCPNCDKTFREKGKLIIHERIHTGEKPFCCSKCD